LVVLETLVRDCPSKREKYDKDFFVNLNYTCLPPSDDEEEAENEDAYHFMNVIIETYKVFS